MRWRPGRKLSRWHCAKEVTKKDCDPHQPYVPEIFPTWHLICSGDKEDAGQLLGPVATGRLVRLGSLTRERHAGFILHTPAKGSWGTGQGSTGAAKRQARLTVNQEAGQAQAAGVGALRTKKMHVKMQQRIQVSWNPDAQDTKCPTTKAGPGQEVNT